jgi:AcrR family transcriptional regulator
MKFVRWGLAAGTLAPSSSGGAPYHAPVVTDLYPERDGPDEPEAPAEPGGARWWRERQIRLERRRPRSEGLTIERIIDEALALVDEEGLDALTVRRLATRLDTGSATLYRHVASRTELLVLMVDHVIGEVVYPSEDQPPRRRTEVLAHELRRVLLRHPNLVPALRAAPLLGPNAVQGAELALVTLMAGGYPPDTALLACLALIDYVLGSVFFDTGRVRPADGDLGDEAFAVHREAFQTTKDDDVFRFGLQVFLDGLAIQLG